MRLYLDANAIIYAVEGKAPFREAALDWIQRTRDSPGGQLLTSRLSRIECRSKPAAQGARDLLARYDRFLQFANLGAVSAEVIERAGPPSRRARLRATRPPWTRESQVPLPLHSHPGTFIRSRPEGSTETRPPDGRWSFCASQGLVGAGPSWPSSVMLPRE